MFVPLMNHLNRAEERGDGDVAGSKEKCCRSYSHNKVTNIVENGG
jgi:hypothetical protein